MKHLLQLFLILGALAATLLAVAIGFAQHDSNLLAPVHFFVFAFGAIIYVAPIGLAMHRNCEATRWISILDIFLGWTVIGWMASMIWAARGKVRTLPAIVSPAGSPGHG